MRWSCLLAATAHTNASVACRIFPTTSSAPPFSMILYYAEVIVKLEGSLANRTYLVSTQFEVHPVITNISWNDIGDTTNRSGIAIHKCSARSYLHKWQLNVERTLNRTQSLVMITRPSVSSRPEYVWPRITSCGLRAICRQRTLLCRSESDPPRVQCSRRC